VPLTASSTRGDQLLNAAYFQKKGYAVMLDQDTATPESLVQAIDDVYRERERFTRTMEEDTRSDGTQAILDIIRNAAAHD
jgi:UDP-N-acetylglucosamine--N-acetylmuramyl-(pentapeptide) pyrophosphoryl-undecaprenol N-acetylglucosamine transferase